MKQRRVKFKFVNNPHIYLEEKEVCKKINCKNVHLWFNKRSGVKQYGVAFIDLKQWKYVSWCLAKEICIPEEGLLKEITSRLEGPGINLVELSKEAFEIIFEGNKENWKLNTW